MDITNENFMQYLPQIADTIRDCDFIAIDTELSGLMRERSSNRFDLPEERFAKSVESSRGYFIMQFGLSCFTKTSQLQYVNRTYNFYIFPQANKFHGDINRTFSLQAHAVQFLTKHGFDFNKLFKHGVSYLTFQEKKMLTARLKTDMKERSKAEFDKQGVPNFVPPSMSQYCRDWIRKINKFAESRKKAAELRNQELSNTRMSLSTNNSDNQDSEVTQVAVPSREDRFEIRDCLSQNRQRIMRQVVECLPLAENLKIEQETDTGKNETYLVIYFLDKKVKIDELKNDLIMSKGFLEVIELIIVHKKPLVGHNLTLDLIQIVNQFMEPLDDDYASFKETCHSLFPLIYDTKYIAHSILDPKTLTNNQSRLNDLYCQLRDHGDFPKIEITHLGAFFDQNQLPHQAGYDAFMSGYTFIALCEAYTGQSSSKKSRQTKDSMDMKPACVSWNVQILNDFANRIHLSYSYDFKCFYLGGEEEKPDRSHVFYVEHPGTWNLEDIFQLFNPYGGVEVSKLNKISALCALRDKKQTLSVRKMVKDLSMPTYKIWTYETYVENCISKKKKACGGDNEGDVTFTDELAHS